VIFDEASQCYAEYGIPALYRAKQIVVAGDSQQLQPNDIYRIKFDNQDQDDSPELEAESLLDLMAQRLPQTRLEGHYRSQSLDLISFSNQHFYQNKLQLLPHFEHINRIEPAIKYIKVEGFWKNNSNQIEAERVIALIKNIQESEPELSIGVVTFNYHQQRLIQDLLDLNIEHNILITNEKHIISNKIFVKNIENVQGDECDVIIFSIAYAADLRGVVKAQFGHLNREGGQNRLNVAITRARLRVYVITSLWPQQLQVEDSLHSGPKLLKAYLQYAKEVSDGLFVPKTPIQEKYRPTWMLKSQPIAHLRMSESIHLIPNISSLKTELPFADLTIKNGNQYEGVIITDDDLYYQSRSVKEAHAYLPMHLKTKKWPFERLWSREWWRKQSE
jgi:superfamily I DNA and/or RNA helicase